MATSRDLNDQFRMLFEAAPNGVMAVNAAGCIIQLNALIEKMFGYSSEELIGRPVEVLVPVRFRQGHVDLRKKFTAAPEMRLLGMNRDLFGMRKDGSEFAIEVGLNSMGTSVGDVVVAAIVDITERKRTADRKSVYERGQEEVPLTNLVERLFALTPAEARVAVLIGSGLSPRQAAENLGVSEGTLRTTLKHVFSKAGVMRQSELAVLITKLTLR